MRINRQYSLNPLVKSFIDKFLACFREDRSIPDQVFTLQMILDEFRECKDIVVGIRMNSFSSTTLDPLVLHSVPNVDISLYTALYVLLYYLTFHNFFDNYVSSIYLADSLFFIDFMAAYNPLKRHEL